MPSVGGTRFFDSGNDEFAIVSESVRVERRSGKSAVVAIFILLKLDYYHCGGGGEYFMPSLFFCGMLVLT